MKALNFFKNKFYNISSKFGRIGINTTLEKSLRDYKQKEINEIDSKENESKYDILSNDNSEVQSFDFFGRASDSKHDASLSQESMKIVNAYQSSQIKKKRPCHTQSILPPDILSFMEFDIKNDDDFGGLSTAEMFWNEEEKGWTVKGSINNERYKNMEVEPFIKIHKNFRPRINISGYNGIRIVFKGDGNTYRLRIVSSEIKGYKYTLNVIFFFIQGLD